MTQEELKNLINLDSNLYTDIRGYKDNTNPGIAALRVLTEKEKKKFGIKNNHEYVFLITIEFSTLKKVSNNLQPLFVHMQLYYRSKNNSMYEDGALVEDYSYLKKQPVPYISNDSLFITLNHSGIVNAKNESCNTNVYLQEIFNSILNSTKYFSSLNCKKRKLNRINFFIPIINFLLNIFSGKTFNKETLKSENSDSFVLGKYNELDNKLSSIENILENDNAKDTEAKKETLKTVSFFGFEIRIVPVFTYSFMHLVCFFIFYFINLKPKFIQLLLNYEFLTIIYVISSFFVFLTIPDMLFSYVLSKLYKKSSELKNEIYFSYKGILK